MLPEKSEIDAVFCEEVSSNPVVIYSKTTCGYCTEAKKLFDEEKINYLCVDIDKVNNGRGLFESVAAVTHSRYVPQIFICGKYVGGYDVISAMRERGVLQSVVDKCLKDKGSRYFRP